jgi:lipopolysaccharide export system permease protein
MQGEKLAKQNFLTAGTGIWMADFLLLVIGLMFLRAARNDVRLFESDFYRISITNLRHCFSLSGRFRKFTKSNLQGK